ncbi:MAG: hypothetical protein ISR20_05960 [Candidatus Poseidonia sp.]|nr:hypothetical protein [Poseidonia sp.]
MGATQSVILANAVSTGMFNTPITDFLTQGWGGKSQYIGATTTSISLPDLFERLIPGGSTGMVNTRFPNLQDSIKSNLQSNGPMMVAQLIGIPIAFNVARSVLRKPLILPANRMLKKINIDAKL